LTDGTEPSLLQSRGGGPAGELIEHALQALQALRACRPTAPVHDRVAWPLLGGRAGAVRFAVEPQLPGQPSTHLDEPLWNDCLEPRGAARDRH
jgi:hypothetical protein